MNELVFFIGDNPPTARQRRFAKKSNLTLKYLKVKHDVITELQKAIKSSPVKSNMVAVDGVTSEEVKKKLRLNEFVIMILYK